MARRLALALAGCALATSACAAAGGVPETSDTPRRDLAVRPSPINPGGVHRGAGASGSSASPRPGDGQAGGHPTGPTSTNGGEPQPRDDGSPTPGSVTSAAPFHGVAAMRDPRRDAGLDAPAYADLRTVTLADNGKSLRVTLTLAGGLPTQAASGETLGIGVDLYRPGSGRESDYQLFADGEPDGWYAYLDTPKGFVRYPGTFGLGGNRIVFTVPWSSVGQPRTGRFSAFVDWSRRSTALTGNKASNDFAPTVGTTTYSR